MASPRLNPHIRQLAALLALAVALEFRWYDSTMDTGGYTEVHFECEELDDYQTN